MPTATQIQNTTSSRATRHTWKVLVAASLFIACTLVASAQVHVAGNAAGRERWVRIGDRVENGTLITVNATGTVNVGTRGSFGPEGTLSFPRDRDFGFPTDVGHLYGLVIRLTSSATNSNDEVREDYAYGASRTICSHARGHLWLAVNDNTPGDNSGEFVVNITIGSCTETDTHVRSTRIHVSSDANVNQAGAEVYVNESRVGVTGSDGTLVLPELPNGSRLMARLQIFENPTYRSNHSRGSTRDWNFRVYQTSAAVNDNGSLASSPISDPTATQELRLSSNNTLVGLHLVASVEWDASRAELEGLRDNQFRPMSQFLFNATDGQFFIEQVDLVDDAAFWGDTDFRIAADLDVRPNVNLRTGGFLYNGLGTWENMRRDPGMIDGWSQPITYAHEFGHYGLDLQDEYWDGHADKFCAPHILESGGDFGSGGAKASCMMFSQFRAAKLCSDRTESPHVHGTWQGDQSCWSHLATQYRDTRTRSFLNSWQIRTPDTRGAVVGSLPNLLAEWQPRVNIENRSRSNLCQPFTIVVTNRDTGLPLDNVQVWLRTSYDQHILEGTSGGYTNPGGGTVRASLGAGMMPLTGIHVGDRIVASGGEYVVTTADCAATSRLDPVPMKFLAVAARMGSMFTDRGNAYEFNAAEQSQQKRPLQINVTPEPFVLAASIEPGKAGQVRIRVRSTAALKTPPQVAINLTGSTGAQPVTMSLDQATASYTGTATLPVNTKASLQVTAIGDNGQPVTRLFSLALSPLNANSDSHIFSANGQLSLIIPTGALPADAIVSIGPSSVPPPSLDADFIVVSGPFSVAASTGQQMKGSAVVRFQLPNRCGDRATDGFDSKSFEIRRYNPENKMWESLGGTLLESVDVISLTTDHLGDYAVTARLLSGASGGSGKKTFTVTDAVLKADEGKIVGRCPALVKFTGYITANGPGTVKYTFTRSDGATGPDFTLEFGTAGTQSVNTTWMLGGAELIEYKGWQALKILSPNDMESSHDTGSFYLGCSK